MHTIKPNPWRIWLELQFSKREVVGSSPHVGKKELGFFHTIIAQTLTAHNICLTHITPSILIYANALGYVLSIRVEFVMQNMMSICLYCCIWKGGLKSTTSRKFEKTNKTAYL